MNLTRRDFLKTSGAIAATGTLAACAGMSAKPGARVVVVGGGFGGATCAKYIRKWSNNTVGVTLVERNEKFISCPLSNLVLGGSKELSDLTAGYDNLVGELADDLSAATAAGLDITSTQLVDSAHLDSFTVVDIRQHAEFAAGHIPGARNVELGTIGDPAAPLPVEPLAVMCGHGERGATAASILERTGRTDVAVLIGGPDDWAAEHHKHLAAS